MMASTDSSENQLFIQRTDEEIDPNPKNRRHYEDELCDSISRYNSGTASIPAAIFIVVNAAMGAGLLNFPHAFSDAGGIGPAVAMEMIFCAFIVSSLFILAQCAQKNRCSTYQEVIESTCGKGFGVATEICIVLYMFGTCIAMLIIIGDQFDKVMEVIGGVDFCKHWYMNRKFTICAFGVLIVLPLCIPKRIEFLRHASIVGVLATIFVVVAVVAQYFVSGKTPVYKPRGENSWASTFRAAPAIFFAYQCHVSSVPVYAALKEKTMTRWSAVIISAITLCASTYTLTGIFGYLTLGDDAKSDILESYDASQPTVIAARVCVVIAMVTSYPIVHFCGRSALFTFLQRTNLIGSVQQRERLIRCIATVCWFTLTLALAILVPNIGVAIDFVGGLAACFIIVFPGMALARIVYDYEGLVGIKSRALFAYGLLLFVGGIFLFGEITTRALQDNISGKATELSSKCYSKI